MSDECDKFKIWKKHTNDVIKKASNILCFNSSTFSVPEWFINTTLSKKNIKIYIVNTLQHNYTNKFQQSRMESGVNNYHELIKNADVNNTTIVYDESDYLQYIYLLDTKFDFIYIDTSKELDKLFTILLCFMNLLKEDGVIIFDNYQMYELDNKIKRYRIPQINVDTILHLFKDQIKILFNDGFYIIKKIKHKNDIYEKVASIQTYSCFAKIDVENNDKLKFNLILKNDPDKPNEKYGFDNKVQNIIKILDSKTSIKHNNYDLNKLLTWYYNFNVIYHSFSQNILNLIIKYDYDPYENFKKLFVLTYKNTGNHLFEYLSFISKYDVINKKNYNDKICLLDMNYAVVSDEQNYRVKSFVKNLFNVNECKFYDIDYNMRDNSKYKSQLHDIDEIITFSSKLKNKIDIININTSLHKIKGLDISHLLYEEHFSVSFFYTLIFILINQQKGGTFSTTIFSIHKNVTIQILWIIKKYYETIYFVPMNSSFKRDIGIKVVGKNFKGINSSELDELINIAKKINEKYDDWENNNYKFIDSIINISVNKNYEKFINDIIKYNTIKKNITENYLVIWKNIINSLESLDKNEKNKFENFIFTIQLKNLSYWIDTYKVV
jgi:hypothetical protein